MGKKKSGAFYEKVENIKMPIRVLILVGTLVLLAGLFTYFLYLPMRDDIKKSNDEISRLEKQLNQARVKASKKEEFEAEFALVDAQFQEALKLLPNEKEIPALLKTITQLGSDSQLEFRLFRPQKERSANFYLEIPVSIEVKGTYHNVAGFFDKVGQMNRIVNIVNVSMQPVKERSTTLVTTCDAVTYSFKGNTDDKENKKK